MYEPIRTHSVHRMAVEPSVPHRSREAELDIRLAGHLTALLTVTDELRAATPSVELDEAADSLCALVTDLNGGRQPLRAAPTAHGTDRLAALHQRARMLAGNALSVATSRNNTAAIRLSSARMAAHTAALELAA